ncbi:hypothetical protein [Mesomycoplasma ovipneumoniae]|uniref:hypothetical protein n=1 Tax=Mesomycoplasma ovipneumoniae TaxID=29562 RepID=UPI00030E0B77|nr:hypothetical protein [Mesomycoplasma ovipneumoniae]
MPAAIPITEPTIAAPTAYQNNPPKAAAGAATIAAGAAVFSIRVLFWSCLKSKT